MSAQPEAVVETPSKAASRLLSKLAGKGGHGTMHEYDDAGGRPVFWRVRIDYNDGRDKLIRPMHREGDAYALGLPERPVEGWPLYLVPELLKAPADARVWVVEGEKCVTALDKLHIVATTSGSCTSADGADWTPLRGRDVTIWPDNDEPGRKYAEAVTHKLQGIARSIRIVDVAALGLPNKGDVVNWLAAHPGATRADIESLRTVLALLAPCQTDTAGISLEPLPSALPPVPAFDARLLPNAVRPWCENLAAGLQVALDFTAIPAVVGLAGAIGRSLGIAMKRHEHWVERPMLWACVVGRPSSGKSPALRPAYRMLERLSELEHAQYETALRDFEAGRLVGKVARKRTEADIAKALKAGDKTGAAELAHAVVDAGEAPAEPRVIVNDATVEALGEILNANPRGVVQYRDELAGWLASLDREGREADRGFYLECWNGTGSYTVDRIGRGTIHIDACALSILGGMQPGKLAAYVRGAVQGGFADDGLMQRFQLAVHPDLPPGWRYIDAEVDDAAEAGAWAAFQRLRNLNPVAVGAERADWCDVPFLRFDDEAQDLLIEWMEQLMGRLRRGDEPPWMESHLAKYPALAGRLALVLHLADGGTGPVSADTLAGALNWCTYLEAHARRIYAPAGDNGLTAAHLILKKRKELADGFTARELHRHHWAGLDDVDTVRDGIDVLLEYQHIIELLPGNTQTGGRPSVSYAWRAA